MPRKTRLALTAIAATAVSVTAAPSSFAATAHAGAVTAGLTPQAADVSATAHVLGYSPTITKQGDAFAIGFFGPGCGSLTGGSCQDPNVPTTGTTWSLDVQDAAGGAVTNLATGTGAVLDTTAKPYTFPVAPTTDGTWKVTVTFTNGTDTWSSSTLVDRGTATNAPIAPTLSVKTTGVSAGEPETFYATGSRVAAGSAKHQLLVHYGDGTSDTIDVTGTDPVAFTHVFSGAQPRGTAWVQTFDGTNLSSWAGISVDVSPVDGKLIVTPTSGTGSAAAPLVVTLDARGATTGVPGATITDYNFYCYGGTLKLDPATPGLATCSYTTPGSFKVSVSVKDSKGNWGWSPETTVTVTAPGQTASTTVARVSGDTRYDTGVHVSKQRWAAVTDTTAKAVHPDSVVLATGGGFADALAGVPFSVSKNGALLLTEPTELTPAVRDEIKRILPADGKHTVYVLGGTAALSPAVADALTELGYNVKRISGATRYDTALEIAHAMGDPAHTVVARGDDFADALAAGPLASDLFGVSAGSTYVPAAIVLSNNKSLDAATTAYLKGRYTANSGAGQSVVAVGGGAAQALTAVPGFDHNSGSYTGATRYETARKVADQFLVAKPGAPVGVATGMAYPDALTGGAFMAAIGGPLLLTAPTAPSDAMTGALAQRNGKIEDVYVFGGPNAVAAAVFTSIVATVHGIAKQF